MNLFEEKPFLNELFFKYDKLEKLSHVNVHEFLNLLFYGPSGCGKTTQIYAFLASMLKSKAVYDLKNCIFEYDKKIMNYKSSIYHIEIDPIVLCSNEKYFIQYFLKQYIETINIGLNIPKIIIVKNADLLSTQTQLIFRKMLEGNIITSRFIFELSTLSKFCEPLRSRCLLIKIKNPNINDIKNCIYDFINKKNIIIQNDVIDKIIIESNKTNQILNMKCIFGHLRYFIYTKEHLELVYHQHFEELLSIILLKKTSFVSLKRCKDLINELYINLVSMKDLIHFLFFKLLNIYKDNFNYIEKLIELTSKTELNMNSGNKESLHIEFYIVSLILEIPK